MSRASWSNPCMPSAWPVSALRFCPSNISSMGPAINRTSGHPQRLGSRESGRAQLCCAAASRHHLVHTLGYLAALQGDVGNRSDREEVGEVRLAQNEAPLGLRRASCVGSASSVRARLGLSAML